VPERRKLFARRLTALICCITLVWVLLVARLAQIQIGGNGEFDLEDYTRTGGSHLVATVRGGIYARWGSPLAEQVPSFDLAVHYSQLPLFLSRPWEHYRVQELTDEFLRATMPAGFSDDYVWAPDGRPVLRDLIERAPAESREALYERLWAARSMASREHGSLEDYVRRRLAGESRRRIASESAAPGVLADWRLSISRVTGVPVPDIAARADSVVGRIERIRRAVKENTGWDHVRVVEEDEYHWIVRGLPEDLAAALRVEPDRFHSIMAGRRELPAVRVVDGTRREYPNGSLAAHIVGNLSLINPEQWRDLSAGGQAWTMDEPLSAIAGRYRMDDQIGVGGIEEACEDVLRGQRGYVVYRLAFGLFSVDKESTETPPIPGADVYLTVREDLQEAANAALRRAAGEPGLDFHSGAVVVVDVHSGAVLAAATWPTYDPGRLSDPDYFQAVLADPLKPMLFRPTQGAYPTGSIYKIVTTIGALEEGVITPQTTFTCEGRQRFGPGGHSRWFHCTGFHRTIPLVTAIERSCNIYFYNTGLRLGGEKLADWGRRFGLGMPTGVDLPHARSGQLPDPKSQFGTINLSIGHGDILCTPLQVAVAVAAVANGGRIYTPHFVDHIRNASGDVVRSYEPTYRTVPVRESTLRVVREGMVKAAETGTARHADLVPHRVAAKTGTAEIQGSELNYAWIAGYAPHDDPEIAFAVVSEKTTGHGGSHAGPIIQYLLDEARPFGEPGA
jgi:penicillin-binding protein 2